MLCTVPLLGLCTVPGPGLGLGLGLGTVVLVLVSGVLGLGLGLCCASFYLPPTVISRS